MLITKMHMSNTQPMETRRHGDMETPISFCPVHIELMGWPVACSYPSHTLVIIRQESKKNEFLRPGDRDIAYLYCNGPTDTSSPSRYFSFSQKVGYKGVIIEILDFCYGFP